MLLVVGETLLYEYEIPALYDESYGTARLQLAPPPQYGDKDYSTGGSSDAETVVRCAQRAKLRPETDAKMKITRCFLH